MLSVPFPVITLLALFLLLVMTLFSDKTPHRGTLCFFVACIFMLSISTLRWEYDSALLRNIQSGLAMLLPPVAWQSFTSPNESNKRRHLVTLFVPATIALVIRIFWPSATDFVLFLLFFGYGYMLFQTACSGENNFTLVRLNALSHTRKMALLAGCFLCISALTDLVVALDFATNGGKLAPVIVVFFQVTMLPFIGATIVSAGSKVVLSSADSRKEKPTTRAEIPESGQAEIYFMLEKKVRETQLYLNSDLTLSLLARKMGIPARQLSSVVNAVRQCNVSQWINHFRIERAQELLLCTVLPVTDVMLESGFSTKSNFNREFQRICGISPTLFRQQASENQVTSLKTH
ncbi:helix-turn-helix domain-containing protein [Rahnella sikkimica]|uniref:AraC family transcriptional regulator n=1 Tax=Rahnella sikkimica TaxID=1805933 RepID=A0A2L1UXG6_9GAMM|nr:AraC family transcriptional regulator [Rahnella sikkimica]AVF37615.1 AraC family transcriptional regulator [Rahnella sikkimica]